MNLKNNYMQSDYGWFYPEWSEIRKAIFSSISSENFTKESEKYQFKLTLRMDKKKDTVYIRTFKNLVNIFSEVGGFASSLMTVGFLICKPFSELNLNN